jgi:glucose-1-phosphate thymidylyltransferase
VSEFAEQLKPSDRGELEITDLNNQYLKEGNLRVQVLRRGMAWLDTGTPQSLLDASNFISAIETRQGLKVACLEEVAFNSGFLSIEEFKKIANEGRGDYFDYMKSIISPDFPYRLNKK